MSRVELLSPRDNLVRRTLALLLSNGSDYSRTGVIFQGKRPGHFLRKAVAQERQAACIPPRVFSIDAFVEHTCQNHLGLTGTEIGPLDAVALLFDLHHSMDSRIGGRSFDSLDAFLPLGLQIFHALEDLTMGLVTAGKLRGALGLSRFPNGERLADLYASFYERVQEEGGMTRALRYSSVAKHASTLAYEEFDRIVVAGFYAFTPVEQVMIKRLLALDHTVFLFQDGPNLASHLRSLDIPYEKPAEDTALPDFACYNADSTHGEIMGLNSILQTFLRQGVPFDEQTVIVLPAADALFPLVQWTLPLVPGDSYNISLPYPGIRTPVFGFLSNIIQLLGDMHRGRFYAPEYTRLLLHPYMKNIKWNGRPEVTRILVHTIEEIIASRPGQTFLRLEDLEHDEELQNKVVERTGGMDPGLTVHDVQNHLLFLHDATIRRLLQARNLGEFAGALIEILSFVDDASLAGEHELFRPFVLAMIEQLDLLSRSRLASFTSSEVACYGMIVRSCLREASVPFPGTPVKGLQILGFLETRNLQFKRVILLDADDDILPGRADVDPLLPSSVRRELGLATRTEREETMGYYFDVLVRGAEEVHLVYHENGKGERSRFVERLLWEKQRRTGSTDESPYVRMIGFPVKLANTSPEAIGKTTPMVNGLLHLTLSASALDCYLACPLRFYYRHLLRLREKDEVEGEMDSATIGTFVHGVLSELDTPMVGRRLQPGENREAELQAAVEKVFRGHFGDEPGAAQFLLKEQVQRQLLAYLSWYDTSILRREPVELLSLETDLECRWEGLTWRGRADRIEQRGDRVVVIDYKTAADARKLHIDCARLEPDDPGTWPDAVGSFQLPLYLLMYSRMRNVDVGTLGAQYVILGSTGFDEENGVWLFEGGVHHAESWDRITRTLVNVLKQIHDPSYPFHAAKDLQKSCPGCSFSALCGTTWVRSWGE